MDSIARDLRFAWRSLLRAPGFLSIAVLTLALGIGATTAIFSVINGVMLRPLPFANAERVVHLWQLGPQGHRNPVSDPNYQDWKAQTRSFAALAQFAQYGMVSVSGISEPVRARMVAVSADFFTVLGVRPLRGRLFVEEEQRFGGTPAVIVSHAFWQRSLGGDPAAVPGGTLTFQNNSYTVVGVLPPGVHYPMDVDLWTPRELFPISPSRTAHNFQVIGLVAPGVSIERARQELSAASRALKQQYGDDTWMSDATVVPLREQIAGRARPALLVLAAAAAVLLLIACANVVNLLLARMAGRHGEFALRLALGAGRGRLAQQLVAESLVISVAAAALGLLFAVLGVRALVALQPGNLPRVDEIGLSPTVLLFTLGVALLTTLGLGLVTALRGARGDLREALAEAQRTQAGAGASYRLRGVLVVTQVALTLVLLVGAGLLGRSFLRLLDIDPGYRTRHTVVLDLSVPRPQDDGGWATVVRLYDDLTAGLRAIPGVLDAGGVSTLPLAGDGGANGTFLIMSRPDEPLDMERIGELMRDRSRTGYAEFRVASDGYFRAMDIPLERGRLFEQRDAPDAPHVAVISASLARSRWPDEDPLGRIIQYGNMDGDMRPFTIVGVVGDVREGSLAAEPRPTFYAYYRQRPGAATTFNFVMHTDRDPAAVIMEARRLVTDLRPDVPPRFRTIETVVSTSVADRRFMLFLTGVFGGAALLLATLGVYSVISYVVTQRYQEIAMRVALGAESGDVLRLVIRQGTSLALIGIGVGTLVAVALTRLLSSFLFGVGATDPVAFGGVILLLVTVALVASWLPARRAARIEPMQVLRGS